MKYRDFPFEEVCAAAKELADQGALVHQKFTCAGCGERLSMEEPNKFYETGSCDKCNVITNIKQRGCNYFVIASGQFAIGALLRDKREGR